MKRKLAVLTALGALVALAIPASSMASMYPAGHQFELGAGGAAPKVSTSLGNCTITKVAGTIPSAPTNETATEFPISTPTVGTCSAGTSLTLGGEWKLIALGTNPLVSLGGSAATLTMKFSSLPGCKLSQASGVGLFGIWSNGATAPSLLKSGYHPHAAQALTWSNDGGTCSLAGKTETVSWTNESVTPSATVPLAMTATDTTSPTSVVVVGAKK
jgi:hypothetical protein